MAAHPPLTADPTPAYGLPPSFLPFPLRSDSPVFFPLSQPNPRQARGGKGGDYLLQQHRGGGGSITEGEREKNPRSGESNWWRRGFGSVRFGLVAWLVVGWFSPPVVLPLAPRGSNYLPIFGAALNFVPARQERRGKGDCNVVSPSVSGNREGGEKGCLRSNPLRNLAVDLSLVGLFKYFCIVSTYAFVEITPT